MTKYPLPYAGERWLFENHPRAWGYHKAMVREDDPGRRDRLIALVPNEDLEAIQVAYTAVTAKTRRFSYA